MTEILPGVFGLRIPMPNNPLASTNVYLLRGERGCLLVDAGYGTEEAWEALRRQLGEVGVRVEQVSIVVVTHGHPDHVGLAGKLKDLTGARVAASPRLVRSQRYHLPPLDTLREWMRSSGIPERDSGMPEYPAAVRGHLPATSVDVLLEDGDTVPFDNVELRTIATPGHSPEHICLYDVRRRVLFSGDHVLPVTTPNIGLRPGTAANGENNPLGDYLASLRKVRDLDVQLVLPAHEHVFPALKERVDQILEHHRKRSEEILGTLRGGPKTAYQISELVTWRPDVGGIRFHDLGHWDQRMAVAETIAHLRYLQAEGTIQRQGNNGILYYQLKT